jgi:ParB family chromosome partitioning protein
MPLGRGLSSLIPPKDGGENGGASSEDTVVSPQRGETQFDSRPRSSVPNGNPARSVSETLPQAPSRSLGESNLPETFSSTIPPQHNEREGVVEKEKEALREAVTRLPHEAVFQIETSKIVPNPFQPRREFEDGAIDELAESIKQFGIIQPLIVSKITEETETGTNVFYQLIAGERRFRAAKKLGLERVPAIVREIDHPGRKLELALIENIQRRDLNPIEEARAYSRLQDEFSLTQKEIAVRVGKSREVIANSLRLLNLPPDVQKALGEGKVTSSQARMLLSIPNVSDQERTLREILDQKLSVRGIRTEIKRQVVNHPEDPEVIFLKKKLEEYLGMPVKITDLGGKGKITIDFYSKDDIRNFIDKLGGE